MTHLADEALEAQGSWRVSVGSAAVLGLRKIQMDAAPTTAYVLLGGHCQRDCAFCAQARSSRAHPGSLSRVMWPRFRAAEVDAAVWRAYQDGAIQRVCFQVTVNSGYIEETKRAVEGLAQACEVPICVSIAPRSTEDVAALLAVGAERVTIAIDAASEEIYARVKGGSWSHTWGLIERCSGLFPERIGTHLIVGLGESEREMIVLMQQLSDLGVGIGLFAFTPVSGTALSVSSPPPIEQYRRVQVALWLLQHRLAREEDFEYADCGRLVSYGPDTGKLMAYMVDGQAFRTAGCAGCNRPYYNERPGGTLFNYPYPLTQETAARELAALKGSLA